MFGGVYYKSEMPVGWQPGAPPSVAILSEWMRVNAVVLHALAGMEIQPSARENELCSDMEKKFDRVEAKLDLALNLLSSFLAQHAPKPETCPVTLGASAIEWLDRSKTPASGSIILSLYITPSLPQPLMLPAFVRESVAQPDGTRIVAEFTDLSEEVRDSLERTVFRNHRRYVQAMHGSSGR